MSNIAANERTDSRRRGNSYDAIRLVAAVGVLFSHQFVLRGLVPPDVPIVGEDSGRLALNVFFCLSGFLIAKSLERSTDWSRFLAARTLRILPNLTTVLVVSSVVTMVYFENYSHFLDHIWYAVKNLLMFVFGVKGRIPGVFDNMLYTSVNGPLWSLPIELHLYVLLFFILLFKGRFGNVILVFALTIFSLIWTLNAEYQFKFFSLIEYSRLGSFFLSGALVCSIWPYLQRRAILWGIIGLVTFLVAQATIPFNSILNAAGLAIAVVCLGTSKQFAWFSKGGDPSFGIYIFAWPVQQFSIIFVEEFWMSMIVALFVTVMISYGTWHLIEKVSIGKVENLASILRNTFRRSRLEVGKL